MPIKFEPGGALVMSDGTTVKEVTITMMDEPSTYADDTVFFQPQRTEEFTFEIMTPYAKTRKLLCSVIGRGNNWRRMHGLPLLRIPLKERRMKW